MRNIYDWLVIIIALLMLVAIFFEQSLELFMGKFWLYLRIFSIPFAISVLVFSLLRFRRPIARFLGADVWFRKQIATIETKHPSWDRGFYMKMLIGAYVLTFFFAMIWFAPKVSRVEQTYATFTYQVDKNFLSYLKNKAEYNLKRGELRQAIDYYQEHNLVAKYKSYGMIEHQKARIALSKEFIRKFTVQENVYQNREKLNQLFFSFALDRKNEDAATALFTTYKKLLTASVTCRNMVKEYQLDGNAEALSLANFQGMEWYLFDPRLYSNEEPEEIQKYKENIIKLLREPKTAAVYLDNNDASWLLDQFMELTAWKESFPS